MLGIISQKGGNLIQRLVIIVDGHTFKATDLPESIRFNMSTKQEGKQKHQGCCGGINFNCTHKCGRE